jgi:hypothetical protein
MPCRSIPKSSLGGQGGRAGVGRRSPALPVKGNRVRETSSVETSRGIHSGGIEGYIRGKIGRGAGGRRAAQRRSRRGTSFNPLIVRVLPGADRIRGGEARRFPSDAAKSDHFVSLRSRGQQNMELEPSWPAPETKRRPRGISGCVRPVKRSAPDPLPDVERPAPGAATGCDHGSPDPRGGGRCCGDTPHSFPSARRQPRSPRLPVLE